MTQIYPFFISIICGIGVGFVFDLFRLHRKKYKVNAFVLNSQDILFWVFFAFVVAYFTFYVNDGVFRAYEFLGFGIGIFLYLKFICKPCNSVLFIIWKIFGFLAFWIFKILFFPVIILTPPCRFILNILKVLTKKQKDKFIANKARFKRFAKRI